MTSTGAANKPRRRGQPILVFGVLILLWIGGRTMMWQSPLTTDWPTLDLPNVFAEAGAPNQELRTSTSSPVLTSAETHASKPHSMKELLVFIDTPPAELTKRYPRQPATLASHQALWMAALAYVPVPEPVARMLNQNAAPRATAPLGKLLETDQSNVNRWSLDGWLFWRPSSTQAPTAGPLPASYGGSQAGAVLRYQLASSSQRRPSAYIRATTALSGGRDSDLAAGLSARVFPKVPVSTHAEMRVSRSANRTEYHPAAFMVTEIPPLEAPFGVRVSTYAQAGYVGGDFATPFVDGQAKIDREVVNFDLAKIRVGAGTWGGAQKGAARLDIGPTASIDVSIGEVPARVSMDYRHRVAGDAVPQSGLAITLSTGF